MNCLFGGGAGIVADSHNEPGGSQKSKRTSPWHTNCNLTAIRLGNTFRTGFPQPPGLHLHLPARRGMGWKSSASLLRGDAVVGNRACALHRKPLEQWVHSLQTSSFQQSGALMSRIPSRRAQAPPKARFLVVLADGNSTSAPPLPGEPSGARNSHLAAPEAAARVPR